jgi:hypothetical protein
VAKFLKEACTRAHPDPNHYMRLHIDQLMSHCLQVTATVLLSNMGVLINDIVFHLQWNSDAVKLYLRRTPLTNSCVCGCACTYTVWGIR